MSKFQKYKLWHKEFNKFVGPEEYLISPFLDVFFVEHGPEGDRLINCNNKIKLIENTGFKDSKGNFIFNTDLVLDNDGTTEEIIWSNSCVCLDQLTKDSVNGFFDKSGWAIRFGDMKEHPIMLQKDTAELLTIIK